MHVSRASFLSFLCRLYSNFRHKGSGSADEFHKLSLAAIRAFQDCAKLLGMRSCAYNSSMDAMDGHGEKVNHILSKCFNTNFKLTPCNG